MIIIANKSVPLNGQHLKKGLNSVEMDHEDTAVIDQLRIYRKMGAISFTEELPGDTLVDGKMCECHCCPDSHYAKDAAKNKAKNEKRRKALPALLKKAASDKAKRDNSKA